MKKILFILGLLISFAAYSQTGTIPNGESGNAARAKINETIVKANLLDDTVDVLRIDINKNVDSLGVHRTAVNKNIDSLAVHLDTIQDLQSTTSNHTISLINHGTSIGVNWDSLVVHRTDINKNIDSLAIHLDTVQALRVDVNTNADSIPALRTDVNANATAIAGIETGSGFATSDTTDALRIDVNTNADSITDLRTDINAIETGTGFATTDTTDALRIDVNANTVSILSNDTDISNLDDTVAVHLDTLQALRVDVNTNTSTGSTNGTNISSNSVSISTNAGNISDNSDSITVHRAVINQYNDSIVDLKERVLILEEGTDIDGPAIDSASVGTVSNDLIIIYYNQSVYGNIDPLNFDVSINGVSDSIESVVKSGATIRVTIETSVVTGNTVSVSYSPTTSYYIVDVVGNLSIGVDNVSVTNRVIESRDDAVLVALYELEDDVTDGFGSYDGTAANGLYYSTEWRVDGTSSGVFDGSANYFDTAPIDLGNSFSLFFGLKSWIQSDLTLTLASNRSITSGFELNLLAEDKKLQFITWNSSGDSVIAESDTLFTPGHGLSLCIVVDKLNSEVDFYMNGADVDIDTVIRNDFKTNDAIRWGADKDNNDKAYSHMDWIRVYTGELTSTEILSLHNSKEWDEGPIDIIAPSLDSSNVGLQYSSLLTMYFDEDLYNTSLDTGSFDYTVNGSKAVLYPPANIYGNRIEYAVDTVTAGATLALSYDPDDGINDIWDQAGNTTEAFSVSVNNYVTSATGSLFAQYKMENDATDETNNYNGTASGSMLWQSWRAVEGTYATQEGASRTVTLPAIPLDSTYTITGWLYYTSAQTRKAVMGTMCTATADDVDGWEIDYDSQNGRLYFRTNSTLSTSNEVEARTTSGHTTTDTWVHFAAVVDCNADTVSLYVDGADETAIGYNTIDNNFPIDEAIVLNRGRGTWHYGYLDDVHIYSGKLSSTDILYLRNNPGEVISADDNGSKPICECGGVYPDCNTCPDPDEYTILFADNFEQFTAPKLWTLAETNRDWNDVGWRDSDHRLDAWRQANLNDSITLDPLDGNNNTLKLSFKDTCIAGSCGEGSDAGGDIIKPYLDDRTVDEVYLTYDVMFKPGFQWASGGKLPSMDGGGGTSGVLQRPGPNEGWSSAIMWKSGGYIKFFVYHYNMDPDLPYGASYQINYPIPAGSGLPTDSEGRFYFDVSVERWYNITLRVVSNTYSETSEVANGLIECWVDGIYAGRKSGLVLIPYAMRNLGQDKIAFGNFFGGSDPLVHPPDRPEWCLFDNVAVYTYNDPTSLGLSSGNTYTDPTVVLPVPDISGAVDNDLRLIVLTDPNINATKETDDKMSLVRLMTYTNEFDVEGLIATVSHNLDSVYTQPIQDVIDAYESVRSNLLVHSTGYPIADSLTAYVAEGPDSYGVAYALAESPISDGAQLIINAIDKNDDRPIYITVFGDGSVIAQALNWINDNRGGAAAQDAADKLRIIDMAGQDDSGAWLKDDDNYPDLWYYRMPKGYLGMDPASDIDATFAADCPTCFEGDTAWSSDYWAETNIQDHGALGDEYPDKKYLKEGDSPTLLYLLSKGLSDPEYPWYGSWGGRSGHTTELSVRSNRDPLGPPDEYAESDYDPYYMYNMDSDTWGATALDVVGLGNSLFDSGDEAYDLLGGMDGYNMTNLAVSGDTIYEQKADWEALASGTKTGAEVVLIGVGINDIKRDLLDVDSCTAMYQTLVNQINTDSDAKIVCFTLMPARGWSQMSATDYTQWAAFNTWMETSLTGADMVITSNTQTLKDGSDYLLSAYDSGDGIHINAAGSRIVLRNIIDAIGFNGDVLTNDYAPVYRWVGDFNRDFSARMDWSVQGTYSNANHNPVAMLEGDATTDFHTTTADPSENVVLSAVGSTDPDSDNLGYEWIYYEEAGSYSGTVTISNPGTSSATVAIPADASGDEIHVILRVTDDGVPALADYKRAIITVN